MKTTCRNWLVLLSLALGTSGAWAQMDPQNLIDRLRVVGIQKWEIIQTNVAYMKNYPGGAGVEVLANGFGTVAAAPMIVMSSK